MDTVANESVLERPSQDGQVERANAEQSQGESDSRPSQSGQADKATENIRKLQSTYDRKLGEMQAQMQQRDLYIQQLTQQMREAQKAQAPDDFSKLELELQWERQEKAALYQQLTSLTQAQQAEHARINALTEVANRYGVEVKDLEKADDYTSAVELAVKAALRREQGKQQHDEERREANRPDIGGGRTSTPSSRWEQEYEDAQKRKDSAAMQRLLRLQGK